MSCTQTIISSQRTLGLSITKKTKIYKFLTFPCSLIPFTTVLSSSETKSIANFLTPIAIHLVIVGQEVGHTRLVGEQVGVDWKQTTVTPLTKLPTRALTGLRQSVPEFRIINLLLGIDAWNQPCCGCFVPVGYRIASTEYDKCSGVSFLVFLCELTHTITGTPWWPVWTYTHSLV